MAPVCLSFSEQADSYQIRSVRRTADKAAPFSISIGMWQCDTVTLARRVVSCDEKTTKSETLRHSFLWFWRFCSGAHQGL